MEESAAIHIIRTLAKLDFQIRVYDPADLKMEDFLEYIIDPVILDGWNLFTFVSHDKLTYIPIGMKIPEAIV